MEDPIIEKVNRKVTIRDLEKVSDPKEFLEAVKDHLRWVRQLNNKNVFKIREIARKKFRGITGHQKIRKFLSKIIEKFENGLRSVSDILEQVTREVLVPNPPTRFRRNTCTVRKNPRLCY